MNSPSQSDDRVELGLHAFEPRSRANGPGVRFAVWLKGCTLACPGCFNPDTHEPSPHERMTVERLMAEIMAQGDRIQGVSVSGGEPFQQPEGLLALVRCIRQRSQLSTLVFSGYTIEEIRTMPLGRDILAFLDVLIDGRYRASERQARHLRGSSNQRVHLLTNRYSMRDIETTPEAEVRIDARGRVTISGVAPLRLPDT